MNDFGLVIGCVRPVIFSSILGHGRSKPRIRKRRNYIISQVNFGKFTLTFEKNKANQSNEADEQSDGF